MAAGGEGAMQEGHEVSVRERIKASPSALLVESYFAPNLARALAHGFDIEIWCHLAHALMLERQGILAAGDAAQIRAALLALTPEMLAIDGRQEDLYSYMERHLTRTLGPATGGRLHTGRSRNDLHATTARMILRARLLDVLGGLAGLRRAVLAQAAAHAGTVMPGYTHWQHAQPITLGYYLLAFADGLARDHARCLAAFHRANLSPLGAGALATTAFPLDRDLTARLLGFAGLVEVAYDAVASRDDAHEAVACCAVAMTGLSRLAVDLQAWSTLEYGFVELADQHCAVSSIMPQKKNPAALEHIKAAAGAVTGHLAAALAMTKNTAFADVSDGVSAINAPVIEAAATTARVLRLAAEVLDGISVLPARMLHLAETGYGTATELADVIVRETGLSFRMAHNIVAAVVAGAIAAGRPATSITGEALDAAAEAQFGRRLGLAPETVAAALDPARNIAGRAVAGGPAPARMAEMLAARQAALAADGAMIEALAAGLAAARAETLARARR
jgi:argininosuccinate lyase